MMIKNQISLFAATFFIIGFFFLALPEKGYSGVAPIGCCITDLGCIDIISGEIHLPCITTEVLGGSCTCPTPL